jgi:replicative DNA helicase
MTHKGRPHGIQTGFSHIDNLTGGVVPGELWIIAGRPSEGKTTLAGNVAYNMAKEGNGVGFVSTEMTPEQIAGRLILSGTQMDNSQIIRGFYDETDYEALEIMAEDFNKLPLFIYPPDSQADFDKVFSLIRAEIYGKGLKVVIIDYLQNIFSKKQSENRNLEISRFMASLKSLALETNAGFIVLSQLNRDATSGRVGLHHLRDSGSIEQASDNVLVLENPSTWNKTEQAKQGLNFGIGEDLRILTIAKARNARRGDSIKLYLDGEHFQFKED